MDGQEIASNLELLRAAPFAFPYDRTERFIGLVKEFLRRSKAYCEVEPTSQDGPFLEVMGLREIPPETRDEIVSISTSRKWPTTSLESCIRHFRYLRSRGCCDSDRPLLNVYEPLFQILADGGSFYSHHGDICIGDAATVIVRRG